MKLRTEGLSTRELDGELVILDIDSSMYLGVNATGTELMRLLEGGASAAMLEAALIERYGVDAAAAARDVEAFLVELRSAGLLA